MLLPLFAFFVVWCRVNYAMRPPPPPDASWWRHFAWSLVEAIAITPWDQVGFSLKPLDQIGRPYPPKEASDARQESDHR